LRKVAKDFNQPLRNIAQPHRNLSQHDAMITLIDYGMGNLRSVSKALEHLGGKVKITSSPKEIEGAEKLILPGVGAFGDAMDELLSRELIEPILHFISKKKYFLGICLGLQLLFKKSEESPEATGLGIYPGKVKRFHSSEIKIPQMGWNNIRIVKDHPLMKGVKDGSFFYFVHSFYAEVEDPKLAVGLTQYGEEEFPAILGNETTFATQFHPEKSQEAGLAILRNFIKW
jgi:imidazole glycerol-phosphate synthase subunit HisH